MRVRLFDEGAGGVVVPLVEDAGGGDAPAPETAIARAAVGDPVSAGARGGPALFWASVPRAELLGYVQPAFAARSLELSPLDLSGEHFPQGATAGVPVLLVALEGDDALARARLNAARLRDLVLRFAPDAVLAFVEHGARVDARLLAEAAPPPAGLAVAALGAWLAANRGDLHATVTVGPAAVHVRTNAGRVEVGGRATVAER